MFLRSAVCNEFSCLMRGLERCADNKNNSLESAHHFSSSPDCRSIAEVPSFTLRAALCDVVCLGSMNCWRTVIPLGNLQKLFLIPVNYLCKSPSDQLSNRASYLPFLVKFSLCCSTFESIEWPDPAQSPQTSDYCAIQTPH